MDNEKLEKLRQYYKNTGLLIVGLNDSQGVNTTSFLKKGLLDYIALALSCEDLSPKIINAFSLTMNKTEHIDYFFKNNLTLEEIKLSQIYSVVSALEKVMKDIHLPKFLGKFGYAYKLVYDVKPEDSDIKIATLLKIAKNPVMIYSSGVNDLMREVGSNPFRIKKDYSERYITPNFDFTLGKVKNKDTLKKVINSIEKNYNTILGINSTIDVYTLGAYVPKSLEKEELNIFRDLIIAYNEELNSLCKQYNITFIDTEEIGNKYNNSESNFHVSTNGHNALANYILDSMYHNKIEANSNTNRKKFNPTKITNNGSQGVIRSITNDYLNNCSNAADLYYFAKKRELDIAAEHKREVQIFEKVLKKVK